MKKINLAISGCMGRMGQQLIKSSKKNKNFKLVTLTENRVINKYKSPVAPPLVPASPFPASLILVPSSTPCGMVTDIFFDACFLPCPLQSLQGLVISSPFPLH